MPALAKLPPEGRDPILERVAAALADDDPWSSLNLAREEARALLAAE